MYHKLNNKSDYNMANKKFISEKKTKKQVTFTLEKDNLKMIDDFKKGYPDENASSVLDNILNFFREHLFDPHKIPLNEKEEEKWKWEDIIIKFD